MENNQRDKLYMECVFIVKQKKMLVGQMIFLTMTAIALMIFNYWQSGILTWSIWSTIGIIIGIISMCLNYFSYNRMPSEKSVKKELEKINKNIKKS